VKKEYTEKIPALEKYFCREMTKVRKVENLATTEETHQALILHKESLLQALKDCQELKKQIDPRPSIMIFFSNLIISIAMGVLLNINNYRAVSAAVLLFLIRLSFAIIREIQKTRRCFAALPDIFLELTKDYTSISPHRVDGGSMDPIQELSRSRSEAVATSVPGHHQLEVTASNVMSNEAALSVAPDVPLGSDMLVTHGLQPYTA
jgi:hypothetical protein